MSVPPPPCYWCLMHRPQASLERKHRTAITELGLCKQRLEDVKASVARQGVGSEEISRMCAKAEVRTYLVRISLSVHTLS